MDSFYYRTSTPRIVALVQSWHLQRDAFEAQRKKLGAVFGHEAPARRGIDTLYVAGLRLGRSTELDVHWRQPDHDDCRLLRSAGQPPHNASKAERAAIRKEHARLTALWQEHCPPRICSHTAWHDIGINPGSLLLAGGVMFELEDAAYFCLGFPISEQEHLSNQARHQPSYGWIEGAEEILPSVYVAARNRKNNPSPQHLEKACA